MNSNSESAKTGLGKVAIAEENYREAEELLRPIADNSTTEIGAEAQFYLGQNEQAQNNFSAAIEEYAKVKVLFEAFDEWVSKAMYNSAVCHIRLGNRGEAVSTLNSIIDLYPETDAEKLARALLDKTSDS